MKLCLFFCILHIVVCAQINVSLSSQISICSANGVIVVSASNGTPPYTYAIVTGPVTRLGQSQNTFNALPPGNYTVAVTDFNGLSGTGMVTVAGNYIEPTASCAPSGCSITVTGTGGLTPYTYAINDGTGFSPPQSGNTFSQLPNGNYTVRLIDACGNFYPCQASIATSAISGFTPTYTNIGANTATLTINAMGGTPPINYTCQTCPGTPSNTTGIFNGFSVCPHDIIVRDACGNSYQETVSPYLLTVNAICANFTTGNVTLQSQTGTAPFTYTYYSDINYTTVVSSNNTGVFTGLAISQDGVFYFRVTDACGRIINKTLYPLELDVNGCNECPYQGFIRGTASGNYSQINPFPPYTITCLTCVPQQAQTVPSLASFFNIPQGTQRFRILDNCGNVAFDTINCVPDTLRLTGQAQCNTIFAISNVTLGTTYSLYDGQGSLLATNTTGIFPNNPNGMYLVTASNPDCGNDSDSVEVTNVSGVVTYCAQMTTASIGGRCQVIWDVLLNESGSFRLTGGPDNVNIVSQLDPVSSKQAFFGLLPGNYSVSVISSPGCIVGDSIRLPNPTFDLQATVADICLQRGDIYPSGGISELDWTNWGDIRNLCVEAPDDFYRLMGNTTNFPLGGAIMGQTTGNYYTVYQYAGIQTTASCPVDTTTVYVPYYIRPDLSATFGAICTGRPFGDLLATIANGAPPFTFQLLDPNNSSVILQTIADTSANSVTFPNLSAGTYTIRAFDHCGISSDYSTSVGNLVVNAVYQRTCDGWLNISAPIVTGGTYQWMSGSTMAGNTFRISIPDTSQTTRRFVVRVETGPCIVYDTLDIPPFVGARAVANAGGNICTSGNSETLTALPLPSGATGVWSQINPSTGSSSFSAPNSINTLVNVSQTPGRYTYLWSVTGNGCVDFDTVEVFFDDDLIAQVTSTPSSCNPTGSASVSVQGGTSPYSYLWNNLQPTSSINGLLAGQYTVIVTDQNACVVTATANVGSAAGLSVAINATPPTCAGGSNGNMLSVVTGGTSPYTYTWNGQTGPASLANLAAGTYTLVATDANQCQAFAQISISAPSPIVGSLSLVSNIRCWGSCDAEAIVSASGGTGAFQYNWSNGNNGSRQPNLCAGMVVCEARDANGCRWADSVLVVSPPAIILAPNQRDAGCVGDCNGYAIARATGGTGPLSYRWSNNRTQDSIGQLCAGTYSCVVTDQNGCSVSSSAIINETQAPSIGPVVDGFPQADTLRLQAGQTYTLHASGTSLWPDASYTWTPATSLNNPAAHTTTFAAPLNSATVTYQVTGEVSGCRNIGLITLIFEFPEITMPNAFTPNADGVNDVFRPLHNQSVSINSFKIFNRWGRMVYEGTTAWDGRYNGEEQPREVYFFVVEYTELGQDEAKVMAGDVTLVR